MGNKVFIDVVARTARLEKGLAKANKDMKRFRGQVKSTASVLKSAMGAALAFVSVRAIGGYLKATLKAVDATAKLSDRIGETTENITRLQFAADITGAGAAKLAAGLDVLQKRLGEASFGMGEGKAALDQLGLSVESLLQMSPAEQFTKIAEATSRLSSKAQQAAVTAKLFSRANQDLVNTLALGRKGLAELGAEADVLGITFSRMEAAKVEEANDAVTRLEKSLGGLATQLTVTFAPALKEAADFLTKAVVGLNTLRGGTTPTERALENLAKEFTLTKAIQRVRERGARASERPTGLMQLSGAGPVAFGDPSGLQRLEGGEGVDFGQLSEETLAKFREAAAERIKLATMVADEEIRQNKRAADDARRDAELRNDSIVFLANSLVSFTAVGAQESKKQFDTHKKLSIGAALVSTAAGVAKSMEMPAPASWINAAAVIATGVAQIGAIKSTTFGGGGSVAGVSPAPATAAAPARQVDVTFSGTGVVTRGQAIEMLDAINGALGDGAVINVTSVT